jgi:hypothetical protein
VNSVVNIGATAIVTEAATAMFGEAGVSAATGVMTVCLLSCFELQLTLVCSHGGRHFNGGTLFFSRLLFYFLQKSHPKMLQSIMPQRLLGLWSGE